MASLADLTWPEIEQGAPAAVLAVPVGATEQHGPHLPLSTDTDIAVALAEGLAGACPGVVVAPAVAYGSSGEHASFAGTLSIGQAAIELLLVELGRSASQTFARTLFVCAHGGNREPLARTERLLRGEGRDVRAFFPRWGGDAHAGRVETSLMLALHPGRVRIELAVAGASAPLDVLLPRLIAHGVGEVSPNGVLGDPAGACADEGHALMARAVREVSGVVDAWVGGAR